MSKKLPAYSSFDVVPASLKSARVIGGTSKYKLFPRPTAMDQSLTLHLVGGGAAMFHSYKDGAGKYTWRTSQNATSGSRGANEFLRFRSAILALLADRGVRLSTKGVLSNRNVHQRVAVEYAGKSGLRGDVSPKEFYAGALSWVESAAGRNYVEGALIAEIRRQAAAGKVIYSAGKSKSINIDQIRQGNFPLSPKNKTKRSWTQITGEGSALGGRRTGATAAPSGNQTHMQNQATNIVETAENLASEMGASYNPGPGSGRNGRRRNGRGSSSSSQ